MELLEWVKLLAALAQTGATVVVAGRRQAEDEEADRQIQLIGGDACLLRQIIT